LLIAEVFELPQFHNREVELIYVPLSMCNPNITIQSAPKEMPNMRAMAASSIQCSSFVFTNNCYNNGAELIWFKTFFIAMAEDSGRR